MTTLKLCLKKAGLRASICSNYFRHYCQVTIFTNSMQIMSVFSKKSTVSRISWALLTISLQIKEDLWLKISRILKITSTLDDFNLNNCSNTGKNITKSSHSCMTHEKTIQTLGRRLLSSTPRILAPSYPKFKKNVLIWVSSTMPYTKWINLLNLKMTLKCLFPSIRSLTSSASKRSLQLLLILKPKLANNRNGHIHTLLAITRAKALSEFLLLLALKAQFLLKNLKASHILKKYFNSSYEKIKPRNFQSVNFKYSSTK